MSEQGATEGLHMSEHYSPPSAWIAVGLMVLGFTCCTVAFVAHELIWLWILGGIIGAIGIAVGRSVHLMQVATIEEHPDEITTAA